MAYRQPPRAGDVLAGRYELQDQVSEGLGATNWRAHDRVLNRNVRVEAIPSADPRSQQFLDGARRSTAINDHRFLRVLDLVDSDQELTVVVREWARALPVSALLAESPLPNHRAATVIAEVAEAIGNAHEHGFHHRRLTPRQVLLKESGAVRIVGLGVASALAPTDLQMTEDDIREYERLDVEAIGKLLYSCLVSRWPGGHVDGLRAAPTRHGVLLRPRQVRAGVYRELDTVCDRILSDEPRFGGPRLDSARHIAGELWALAEILETQEEPHHGSPDLLRLDPVVVPSGPPPGLEPPRRRPKALEPPPPTRLERSRSRVKWVSRGHRGLVTLGVVTVLAIALVLAFAAGRASLQSTDAPVSGIAMANLTIAQASVLTNDFDVVESTDPALAVDGDPDTGWTTPKYFNNPQFGGVRDGLGLVLDLGSAHEVDRVSLTFGDSPTSFTVYASGATQVKPPTSLDDMEQIGIINDSFDSVEVAVPKDTYTRYLVIWLRDLPEIAENTYQGDIREVTVRGR